MNTNPNPDDPDCNPEQRHFRFQRAPESDPTSRPADAGSKNSGDDMIVTTFSYSGPAVSPNHEHRRRPLLHSPNSEWDNQIVERRVIGDTEYFFNRRDLLAKTIKHGRRS